MFKFLDDPIAGVIALRQHGEIAAVARNNPAMVCVFGPERNREVLSNPTEFEHDEDFIKARPALRSRARPRCWSASTTTCTSATAS